MPYIIGDLHANYAELNKLLAIIKPQDREELVFIGDYIDKLEYFKETIALLDSLKTRYNCLFLKGNHEFVWDRYLNHQELSRQEFLLAYGGVASLSQFSDNPRKLLLDNNLDLIRKYLRPYLDLFPLMADYYLTADYLVLHAGIKADQLKQQPLVFEEINYFLRPDKIDSNHKYLDQYRMVCGHTFLSEEPTLCPAYVNIDLGAGYGKYLACLDTNNKRIIRSDNKIFNL